MLSSKSRTVNFLMLVKEDFGLITGHLQLLQTVPSFWIVLQLGQSTILRDFISILLVCVFNF